MQVASLCQGLAVGQQYFLGTAGQIVLCWMGKHYLCMHYLLPWPLSCTLDNKYMVTGWS